MRILDIDLYRPGLSLWRLQLSFKVETWQWPRIDALLLDGFLGYFVRSLQYVTLIMKTDEVDLD